MWGGVHAALHLTAAVHLTHEPSPVSAASTSTASGGIRPALLRQNPRVRLLPFDGASAHPVRLCEIPDATDTQIRRFTLPASLVPFLDAFDGTRTVDDAIAVFLGTDGSDARPPSAQRVRKLRMLVADALIPYHILVAPDAPAPEAPVRRSYMYARVRLLPAPVVRRIALPLRWLFTPTPAALLLLAAAVMHWSFYRRLVAGRSVSIATLQGTDVLAVIGLVALGTLIHEIGHATAAARYGCTRTEIGWGIYLSFTVLYTDLSEAWRLPRQQRAIIDGAGIYFQCIYLIGLYLVAAAWPGSLARHIFVLSDLAIVGSLNPFFRMDGYWLLSDALGIANLREETRRVWSAAWAWATRHRPVHSFHLPPLATACPRHPPLRPPRGRADRSPQANEGPRSRRPPRQGSPPRAAPAARC